jgi:hypothetical protein
MFNHKKATTMKKYIILTLALALSMGIRAQITAADLINVHLEMDEPTDRYLRLGVYIDNTSDALYDPLHSWYDPTIYLCGLSFDMDLPVPMQVYSVAKDGMATPGHYVWPGTDERYVNRVFVTCWPNTGNYRDFFGLQGRVFTLVLDPGFLSEGEYDIDVSNISMVESNGYWVHDYKKPGFSFRFEMREDIPQPPVPTAVKGVEERGSQRVFTSGPRGIYTLQGVKVETMQPGHIYIVNGKKIVAE